MSHDRLRLTTLTRAALFASAISAALFGSAVPARSGDWARFRGPDGSGTSAVRGLPVAWSDEKGIDWKTELPGPGSSSPIVSGGRIFLNCYSGYGVGRDEGGSVSELKRHVVCLDASTGKLRWDRSIDSPTREAEYRGIGIPNHGYASSTPVADGERVFAFFGANGVVAYDFEGKQLWRANVADDPRTHNFGSASSLLLHEDLLIVPASIECDSIVAFEKSTGKEKWRSPAYGGWWGTPLIASSGGRDELIVNVPGEVWGLNPKNGKLRWYAESFPERNICTSAVVANGVAYAIGGRQGGSAAVRIGGKGDVSQSHVVWRKSAGSYVTSPVVHGEHLYWLSDRGILHVVETKSGEQVLRARLPDTGSVYASLFAADGKLYAVTRRNGTFVLAAKPALEQLAHNTIESDRSDFNASPAVSDGHLLLRSDRFLYAIARTGAKSTGKN